MAEKKTTPFGEVRRWAFLKLVYTKNSELYGAENAKLDEFDLHTMANNNFGVANLEAQIAVAKKELHKLEEELHNLQYGEYNSKRSRREPSPINAYIDKMEKQIMGEIKRLHKVALNNIEEKLQLASTLEEAKKAYEGYSAIMGLLLKRIRSIKVAKKGK